MGVTGTDNRRTPGEIFEPLDRIFHFDWDAAATAETSKCGAHYFGPDQTVVEWQNALDLDWAGVFLFTLGYTRPVIWCNPPYGRGLIDAFCAKAHDAAAQGEVTTVMLLPADLSTAWYRRWVYRQEAYIYRGRGKFVGAPLDKDGKLAAAKFGSILRVFRPPLTEWWLKL